MEHIHSLVIDFSGEPRTGVVDIDLCGYGCRLPSPDLVGALSASARIRPLVEPSYDVTTAKSHDRRLGECSVAVVAVPRELTSLKKAWCLSIAAPQR